MSDLLKIPLVHVTLEDDEDPSLTRICYYVGDIPIMDMSVEKAYVPLSQDPDKFPAMVLTQLLVTPHQHLSLLADFLAVCRAIDAEQVPVDLDRWSALLEATSSLLNPPSPESDSSGQ